ncbi:hypothetical protein RchiOBHm_Chr7g0208451 [Rosa chinensis]|uniref:Uncharacterized protein n=1 Tax=Rosa chinensis TaxID=74649 RepID=A0A2P6P9P7_ROSCH|nr:hypothetical protein RchiOBHm_Chr7g0208451 [Rosa chinensis]
MIWEVQHLHHSSQETPLNSIIRLGHIQFHSYLLSTLLTPPLQTVNNLNSCDNIVLN